MARDPYAHTLAWLYTLEARAGIDLKLERVEEAAAALGHPERAAPTVHVAGTNGKGSTAAMLAAMLRAGGRRVGLFTSPHLVSFRERIVVDDVPISEEEVVEGIARLRRALGDAAGLTCFEVTTLLAWCVFAEHGVEVAVLEVGLGGRLDATNVVTPEVAVITNVGRDHEAYLGSELATIAREKAGIIKPGIPVVSGASGAAAAVVAARAAELASPLDELGVGFTLDAGGGAGLSYRSPAGRRAPLRLALRGTFQQRNAALAIRALEVAPRLTPGPDAVRAGLERVRWPGRLQVVSSAPLVILDGAHNGAGMEALTAEVQSLAAGRRVRVLFGVMRDKAWEDMLRRLSGVAAEIVLTRPRQARAADPAMLAASVTGAFRVDADPVRAFERLVASSAADDVVVVTGSLFLIGDVLPAVDPGLAGAAAREGAAARLAGRA